MKRERIFYLDFIRTIAVILILLTHYNAVFLYMNPQRLDKVVLTYKICNLYIGDFGVSLFFIISGAALMYVYENKFDFKNFYKKRLIGIYPMFWIGYLITFLFDKIVYHTSYAGVPVKNSIFTILGFDSYFSGIMPTYYIIGEWFLGCIILAYILFPLLRWGVNKHPLSFGAALLLIYFLTIICYSTPLSKAILIGTRLPEIFFGMVFMKYFKIVKWKEAVVALIVLVANTIISPNIDSNFQTTYIGIAAFILLTFIGKYLKNKVTIRICAWGAKYCYAIFLIHHYVIRRITDCVDWDNVSTIGSYGVFAICIFVVIVMAIMLYYLDCKIKELVGKMIKKQRKVGE